MESNGLRSVWEENSCVALAGVVLGAPWRDNCGGFLQSDGSEESLSPENPLPPGPNPYATHLLVLTRQGRGEKTLDVAFFADERRLARGAGDVLSRWTACSTSLNILRSARPEMTFLKKG